MNLIAVCSRGGILGERLQLNRRIAGLTPIYLIMTPIYLITNPIG